MKSPPVVAHTNITLPTPIQFEIYRIASANAGWVEGHSTSGGAEDGAACWDWPAAPAGAWSGCKGCGLAGADYDSASVSTATLTEQTWSSGRHLVFELKNPALLADWVTHPEHNSGFILRSSTLETLPEDLNLLVIKLFSNESPNPLYRPRLEIEYDNFPRESLATASFQAGVVSRTANPAYDSMATSLFSGVNGSFGGAFDLRVGVEPQESLSQKWRALLKFDLARMSDRAHVVRAMRLTLTVQSTSSLSVSLAAFHSLQVHRISPANASWREGHLASGETEAGAATWFWRVQATNPWAGGSAQGAGLQTPDVDYESQSPAELILVPGELHNGDTLAFDFPNTGFLYQWIDKLATNPGFRLSSPTLENAGQAAQGTLGQIIFYSDDAAPPSRRPRLDLFYASSVKQTASDPAWLTLR